MKADMKFHMGLYLPLNGVNTGVSFPGNIYSVLPSTESLAVFYAGEKHDVNPEGKEQEPS